MENPSIHASILYSRMTIESIPYFFINSHILPCIMKVSGCKTWNGFSIGDVPDKSAEAQECEGEVPQILAASEGNE